MEDVNFILFPGGDRIIVKPDDTETKSAGGIIIPDSIAEKPRKGTILFVGPGESPEKRMPYAPGDRIVYGKYAGADMKVNDTDIIVIRESDIFFKFTNEIRVTIS